MYWDEKEGCLAVIKNRKGKKVKSGKFGGGQTGGGGDTLTKIGCIRQVNLVYC
jgi:hypothetical protein